MTNKFRNRYRIQSNRMPGWDYSRNGYYFITLITQNRECNLGEIILGKDAQRCVSLSEIGKIVNDEWLKSFEIRDELILDEYIIMPNHLHAIVILKKNCIEKNEIVETHGRASLRTNESDESNEQYPNQQFVRKPKSISSFIGGFKSAINSKIDDYIDENNLKIPKYNRHNHFFQPNYHDHVIRDKKSYQNISQYIINNPIKWDDDKFNPDKKEDNNEK